jgi:hypothetical protein
LSHSLVALNEVRESLAPEEVTLKTARERRDDALVHGKAFDGVARAYNSGSIAHGTANGDTDADCGIVLDRRTWSELGPDGDDVGPCAVVEEVRCHVRSGLRETYERLRTQLTKRAIQLSFHEPLPNETDPSVDLIVGLQREAGGLWIPNLDSDTWDASDPICHTHILTAPPKALRVVRAHVIRVVKGWNVQYSDPGFCSFNVEALALPCVTEDMDLATGVLEFFSYAAVEVAKGNTPDPADVSKPIKLKVDRAVMVARLRTAAAGLQDALDHDDDEDAVRTALADVFWQYLDPPLGASSKAAMARALRPGNAGVTMGVAGLSVGGSGATFKTTRSFGDGQT